MRKPEEIIIQGKTLREILDQHKMWLKTNGKDGFQAILNGANLTECDLSKTFFTGTSLIMADLSGAKLTETDFSWTDLHDANLTGANLSCAYLTGTDLTGSCLIRTNFSKANFWGTIIAQTSLSEVVNIDKIQHSGPSFIDINSVPDLDKLPYSFLKGVGFSDQFINYYPSLFPSGLPIQYYSCFISHSSKNFDFADRLKSEMQSAGLRTWFAPEDLKIGEKIRGGIDQAIMMYDKLMLIISKDSINSRWVEKEVEAAFEKEEKTGKLVLFPIRLDDEIFDSKFGWAADIRRTRQIGDFTHWKDHDSFKKSFERLLRDLKEEK